MSVIHTPSPLRGWTNRAPVAYTGGSASATKALASLKAEYAAGMPSRFRRTRTSLGGLADAHMLNGQQFWAIREYARDMDRNDALFGQLVDRAVDMRIGGGPTPRSKTGDKALDDYLDRRWKEWSGNPFLCDRSKKRAFPELVRAWERATIVDGDVFPVLDDSTGSIQTVEGDHVDSPMIMGGDVFHGVRIDAYGAPIEYQFVDASDAARFAHVLYYSYSYKHVDRPAFDEYGDPVVLHIYDPARLTQTRGITAFHAVFDYLGMVEDVNFATLIKQQMASMVMGFLESNWDAQLGGRDTETQSDGTLQVLQEMQPGAMLRGPPGTKLTAFTPNIPGSDFLEHMKFLAKVLGGALHLPIEIVLMDYSMGNFSSQRMAIDQARQAVLFRRESMARLVLQHIRNWKARAWLAEKGLDARVRPELLAHQWRWTGFPYHDKQADATADKIRVDNLQITRRDLAQENGQDWDEMLEEAVEDGGGMIQVAMAKAKAISTPDQPVVWQDVLGLSTPGGVTTTQTKADPKQLEVQKDAADQKAKSDEAASKKAEKKPQASRLIRIGGRA